MTDVTIDGRICRYWICGIEHLPEKTENLIKELLPECRQELCDKYKGLEHDVYLSQGWRFKDDEMALDRMRTHWEKLEKKYIDMKDRIKDALIDCMSADYYYIWEKEW